MSLSCVLGFFILQKEFESVTIIRLSIVFIFMGVSGHNLAQQSNFQTRTTKARIQGEWTLTVEGNPIFRPPAEYTELKLIFSGDSLYWIQPLFGDTLSGVFRAWTDIARQQEAMALRKDVDPRKTPDPSEDRYTYENSLQQYNYLACMLYDRVGPSKELYWDNFSLGEQHLIFYETDEAGHRWKMLMERVEE